jgi:hypothetical protein
VARAGLVRSDCYVANDEAIQLAQALAGASALRHLDLSEIFISVAGAGAVARVRSQLHGLCLGFCAGHRCRRPE